MCDDICLGCVFADAKVKAFCGVIGKEVDDLMPYCLCYTEPNTENTAD